MIMYYWLQTEAGGPGVQVAAAPRCSSLSSMWLFSQFTAHISELWIDWIATWTVVIFKIHFSPRYWHWTSWNDVVTIRSFHLHISTTKWWEFGSETGTDHLLRDTYLCSLVYFNEEPRSSSGTLTLSSQQEARLSAQLYENHNLQHFGCNEQEVSTALFIFL